jgi:putative DNA modification/repair radical SAM protein
VRRARFTVEEVVRLTLEFYKRNYIEGLFLSSGIIRSSNYTMEQIVSIARTLRNEHDFRGYIHLKTIPDADPELVQEAGLYADRVSINVELASKAALQNLAPEKNAEQIEHAMADMKASILEAGDGARRFKSAPKFAPAGQSTQMIVGADASSDRDVVARASSLYERFALRRVYYSAFSPIPDASAVLPLKRPPLVREHRIYQADWLMRFYGFTTQEVQAATDRHGMLPLDVDPKLAWALKFRESFPVDVNVAPKDLLLRVPGLGTKAVERIISSRRSRRMRLEDIERLTLSIRKVRPFIIAADWRPTSLIDRSDLGHLLGRKPPHEQLELFGS